MAGDCCGGGCDSDRSRDEGWERVLLIALGINAGMFAVEMIAGVSAQSASLMADAIDFLGAKLSTSSSTDAMGVRLHVPVARLAAAQAAINNPKS